MIDHFAVLAGRSPGFERLQPSADPWAVGGRQYVVGCDDITLVATPVGEVPEPATMGLLGLAACGPGRYVRRRRKA